MRSKKPSTNAGIEVELENLREENYKLKDSLILQRKALE